ncbi:MAG: PDZ domain-containing protein [bacterium]|nr:PDZ domain-containing protein [bacterium]
MKRINVIFVLLVLSVMGTAVTLSASSNDILPLGPSKYKFIIDKIEKKQIKHTATGEMVKLADIIDENMDTDVFIIGEAHDNYLCHTFQRDFIDALYKKYPKIVVGFEFFQRDDNEALEQWRKGEISEEELIKKIGWYKRSGQNYGYTALIMDIIKKNNIKTIGLNVPRSILRTVSRKGFDQLSEEEKKLFPTINIPNPEHEYFIKSIFGSFAVQVPMWFNNIYNAQKCWDVIMAESMRQTLAKEEFKGYKGVIVAGSNHVAYKLGIPFRYKKADEKAKITTIVPILLHEQKEKEEGEEEDDPHANPMMKMMGDSLSPAVLFSRGIADYVFCASQPVNRHFPVIGFTIKDQNGKLTVTRVTKESVAEESGIKKGDQIVAVDGVDITTMEQLRLIITTKNWDDSIDLKVIKKVEIKKK